MNGWEHAALAGSRVGHLATVRPDGSPHLVVVTFALVDEGTVVTAVDAKPKRTTDLQRLRNLAHSPRASLLVDEYDEDWERLWWVRLDVTAEVVTEEPERSRLLTPLVSKYVQYQDRPPEGPVIVLRVERQVSWAARPRPTEPGSGAGAGP